jgi:hypothetical protein
MRGTMQRRIAYILAASLIGTLALFLAPISSAVAAPVGGGALTSGKPVNGVVSTPDGIEYKFTAVAGRHVTLAVTSPKVGPSGDYLLMQVHDSSGNQDGYAYISTSPTEFDFTPTSAEAGATTVVISPYNFGATGGFTLTYTAG